MVQLEKRLLWHPRNENKFVVGEHSQIILYEWASEHPEIRHVTTQHDLPSMKCFAWSPDPGFDDLIAVGLSTGKVELIRLEAGKQSRRKNTLSSGPSATLPVRASRACNTLAFSSANPNYLAVGLEKVRGDSGLIIWDVANVLPSLRIPLFEPTEVPVMSVNQSRPLPQIPRIDSHTRNDSRILQQHATAEAVCSLAFLPSSAHLLLSNISNRFLRLFDLRAPSIPPLNFSTKLHGIAVDSFDSHRIASFGDSVTIWDIRKFLQPIMTFSERDALADGARTKRGSSYINIEFSRTRRGTIATLEKESTYVRFWDLTESRVSALEGSIVDGGGGGSSDGETNKSSREASRGARRSWANLPWRGGGEKERSQHYRYPSKEGDLTSLELLPSQQTFVLSDTHRTKYFPRPLASFVLVPDPTPGSSPLTSNVMVVNKDGDLELYAIHDTPKQLAWSARGDLALGAGLGLKVLEGYKEGENDDDDDKFVPEEPKQQKSSKDTSSRGRDTSRARVTERDQASCSPSATQHPTSVTRGRVRQGATRGDSYAIQPTLSLPSASATPTAATPVAPSASFGKDDNGSTPGPSTASNLNTPSTATFSKPTGLSVTRPKSSRRSPASVGKYGQAIERSEERHSTRSGQKKRSLSRTDTLSPDDVDDSSSKRDGKSVSTARGLGKGGDGLQAKSTSQSRDTRVTEVGKKFKEAGVVGLITEDISMIIRRRVKAGYGLSQLQHNIVVTQDWDLAEGATQVLSEFWAWLYHSQEIFSMPTPRLHGYDFSFQGLLGIWEGLVPTAVSPPPPLVGDAPITMQQSLLFDLPTANPLYPAYVHNHSHTASIGSTAGIPAGVIVGGMAAQRRSHSPADGLHGSWLAALATLAARRGPDTTKSNWKPAVHTSKLLHRQIALQVIGWSLRDDELSDAIERWQREGQFARAACWLVFTTQYGKAVELLMRSDDETHQMMSGTIAALAPLMSATGSARGLELRELYDRLINRLSDPYFRMLLTHLSTNEWSEVLDEDFVPFRERLAIALQFLDDHALTAYFRRLTDVACDHGSIEGLILTGLTPSGMRVIQSYLDHTGDVQSAAILSSYVCPHRFKDKRAERWLESYRDLLDGFKLHHLRVGFDIERGQILHEAAQNGNDIGEWAPKQILIRCHYCNKAVDGSVSGTLTSQQPQKGRPTQCSNCNRELPRCAVCLMTLSIVSDAAREAALGYTHNRDTFDDAIVICQTCRHGGHAIHILEWFLGEDGRRTHSICPVADCDCRCADEF